MSKVDDVLTRNGFGFSERSTTERLDTYIDTTDRALSDLGWSMRLRCTPGQIPALELKRIISASREFDREEISQNCLQAPGPVHRKVSSLGLSIDDLAMSSEVHIERAHRTITHPDFKNAEIAYDIDSVQSEPPYIEVEFELKSGGLEILAALQQIIGEEDYLYPSRLSKAQRIECYRAKSRAGESRNWLLAQRQTITNDLLNLKHTEPFAWEGLQPDGVHELRVASRRLRAHLSLFGLENREVNKCIAELCRQLGAVRDDDVHLEQLRSLKTDGKYVRRLIKQRSSNAESLRIYLEREFSGLIHKIEGIAECTTEGSPYARLCNTLDKLKTDGDAVGRKKRRLHKLRKLSKTAAYQIEVLTFVHPEHTDLLKQLKTFKSLLGQYQDRELACARLTQEGGNQTRKLKKHFSHSKEFWIDLSKSWSTLSDQLTQDIPKLRALSC